MPQRRTANSGHQPSSVLVERGTEQQRRCDIRREAAPVA